VNFEDVSAGYIDLLDLVVGIAGTQINNLAAVASTLGGYPLARRFACVLESVGCLVGTGSDVFTDNPATVAHLELGDRTLWGVAA